MPLPKLNASYDRIPTTGLRGQFGPYLADPRLVHAANTALGLELPLLLTGEPGSGKSDFAWVAAHAEGLEAPLRCQVRSNTTAKELLYHFDALVRFADAQHGDRERARDPRHYVTLQPLGRALMSKARQVVLIDEIDKAPRDLPNDLLWELDEGHFEIPEIGDVTGTKEIFDARVPHVPLQRRMERPSDAARPLLVITSNSERQLPDAFLRRCVFFHIPSPRDAELVDIARQRFPDEPPRLVISLVEIFAALRKVDRLTKRPSTSELLNWLEAMTRVYDRVEVQMATDAFISALERGGGTLPPKGPHHWSELPGLQCLVKLREDLDHLTPHGRGA